MNRRDFLFLSSILVSPLSAFTLKELQAIQKRANSQDTYVDIFERKNIPPILIKDDIAQQAIRNIAKPLFKTSSRSDAKCKWRIFLVDSNKLAYTVGYGLIVIDKSLIKICQNETQLASVIAHEIGHVHYKHEEQGSSASNLYGKFGIDNLDKSTYEQLYRAYRRHWEREADAYIIKAFLETEYDINKAADLMKIVAKKYPNKHTARECLFHNHPDSIDRVKKIESIASTFTQNSYKTNDSKEFRYLKQTIGV